MVIIGVSNITLQGQGHIEHGFHETVMQSTSVIDCSDYNRGGIQFINSMDVVLKSLTIVNCGAFFNTRYGYSDTSLLFVNINNVTLEWVSVQNGSGIGIYLYNAFDVLIANSTFTNNGGFINVAIFYDVRFKRQSRVNIVKSNFTLNLGYGMALLYFNENNTDIEVIIENNKFLHNTARYGGGVFIYFENGSGSIEFSNCIMYNNTAQHYGGGVFIELDNGSGNIRFSNCTIYNNTAQYGGGVQIQLNNGSSSIEFRNCTIYNNSAQQYGGGVYIYLREESNSIEFNNCTIYNNTAFYGSGLFINAYQVTSRSSIQFSNVLFHFNKVPKKLNIHQSAVLLSNIENVILEEIEVSNHNTTGLLAINNLIMFDGHSKFVNNSGIYGGGIALYGSSQLSLSQNTNISFVKNHASESGGGIYVSQFLDINVTTDCSFRVIPSHKSDDDKTVLYFVNNTAGTSGDVLYGGKISDCFNTLHFDQLFSYHPQQTGLSLVSSDPIQVCFCESNRQDCSIKSIKITAMPGIDVNISIATVGIKDGLTKVR